MYSSLNTISTIGSLTSIIGVLVMVFVIIQSVCSNGHILDNNSWTCYLSYFGGDYVQNNNYNNDNNIFDIDLTDPEMVKRYIKNIVVNDEYNAIIFVPKYNFFSYFIPNFSYNLYLHNIV